MDANRVDQICRGLQREGIEYTGMMYTNGYLFDEEMADKARDLWHINRMQIVIDGTEELYNRIKNYVNPQDNPYQRVMRNIGLLIDRKIFILVRMNVDRINYKCFENVVQDLTELYPRNRLLSIYAYPLIGDYSNEDADTAHAEEVWINDQVVVLNTLASSYGVSKQTLHLPSFVTCGCMSDSDSSIVIGADGLLVKCGECYSDADGVGTLIAGIIDQDRAQSWHRIHYSDMCAECIYAPQCVQLENCKGAGKCYRQVVNLHYRWAVEQEIQKYLGKGDKDNGFQRADGGIYHD